MYKLWYQKQFHKCQSTICRFDCDESGDAIWIFYSYSTPKLVKVQGEFFRFTFDWSRKEGYIVDSQTTSKQCNRFLREHWIDKNRRDLEYLELARFEELFFDTRLSEYY